VNYTIRILDTPEDMHAVEDLQQSVWPGDKMDIVPMHMLHAAVHHGGLVIGAYYTGKKDGKTASGEPQLVGFVFGIPGFYDTPDGPRIKHGSHMLGVHPDHRRQGLGYRLKRAQWQMVRYQGIDRITWTYDPLLSPNGRLNISKLGAVCSTYHVDFYGEMRDELNRGLPSDRFEVDWWVNSQRVTRRLGKRVRPPLNLGQYLAAEAIIVNPTRFVDSWRHPPSDPPEIPGGDKPILLVEIPVNFQDMRNAAPDLALVWRRYSRDLFLQAFEAGYLVTDFIMDTESTHFRSFYILSHGDSTL
jgi:predicted GNAT superfamily acetyltransferase